MEWSDGRFLLSPSDLSELLGCAHASARSRHVARGLLPKPPPAGEYAQLIFDKGAAHEQAYLDALVAAGLQVVEVGRDAGWQAGAERTARLMRAGVDVIYQGVFVADRWRGLADFVMRIEEQSGLGAWSYEAVDTKLARADAKPAHALQLCFYSEAIGAVQGEPPRHGRLVLGSGAVESIRIAEIAAYYRRAQRTLVEVADADAPTEAYPCEACAFCRHVRACEAGWRADDHLSLVASIRRPHARALVAGGVATRRALATLGEGARITDVRPASLDTLRAQARLQVAADTLEVPPFELLPVEAGRGFARLPEPSPGDVFFDIEGDPLFSAAHDLTFLFGAVLHDGDAWRYVAFWARDEHEERTAFEHLVDLVVERLARHPDLHVYHYSPAEPGVLQRLIDRHATREAEVDDLLRRGVLVDLYGVVRQGLRVGVESYGLKQIERLAGFERAADVGSGADAVLGFERWRATRDQAELDAIAAYNEEDCRATLALRDWLLELRPTETPPAPEPEADTRKPERIERDRRRTALRDALVEGEPEGSWRALAGELLFYHEREARPGWWRWFALEAMSTEELIEDREALGGLEPAGPARPDGRTWVRDFRFPPQQHKQRPGSTPCLPAGSVEVIALDEDAGTTTLRGKPVAEEPPTALVPSGPYGMEAHRDALERVATSIRDGSGRYPGLEGLLRRELPRVDGQRAGAEIQTTCLAEQRRLVRSLRDSALMIQGPPGTGKTWTGARLIVDLLAAGRTVGVTSGSHRAINNLLEAVEKAAAEDGVGFRGARRAAKHHPDGRFDGSHFENVEDAGALRNGGYDLVAGTSWTFAPEAWDGALDYLVIDEAGQFSLADAVAAGTAARNLLLLGDPLQLPQVTQASHPSGSGASVLQHLLGDDATVPPERGIFLERTWRMHPDVCSFISDAVYEGRLCAQPHCSTQTTGLGTGLLYLPVEHVGNETQSREEAERVRAFVEEALRHDLTDAEGVTRKIEPGDIMVVAPYNNHRRLLERTLPAGVPIGTVDAFQGQEAAIVIFSMATSSGDDLPRDVEFLFSRNRLNVAISRAKSLAVLCCAPALLATRARTIEDMRLISTLCLLVERARVG